MATTQNENERRFSLEYFVNNYELLTTSIYRVSAGLEAGLAAQHLPSQDNSRILEIGGGSGTSMFYLRQQYNELGFSPECYMVEPTYGGTRVAVYKLGTLADQHMFSNGPMSAAARWEKILVDNNISVNPISTKSILEKRQIMESLQAPSIIQAWGENLPIASNMIDVVHMIQVFHWTNRQELLKEINRVLKPGQICVFDETGLQFHFNPLADGTDINKYHFVNHPFHNAFILELNALFSKNNLPSINPEKIDRFHNIFNMELLQKEFYETGFRLVPINTTSWEQNVMKIAKETGKNLVPFISPNRDYAGMIDPRSSQDLLNMIKNGGVMRYFNRPETEQLDINKKNSLIGEALQHTDKALLNGFPIAETGAYFVLQKSNSI